MSQKTRNIIILSLVAVLLAVSVYFIVPPGKKTHLGLDLQGGLEVVYQAKTTDGKPVTSAQMAQTLSIIDRRVNGLGVTESQVQQQGGNQISIALPGVTNTEDAMAIIGKTAQLLFFDDGKTRVAGPESSKDGLFQTASGKIAKADLEKLKQGESTPGYRVIVAPPGRYGDNKTDLFFLYEDQPSMTGAAIDSARQAFDQANRPNVLIDFNAEGGKQFEKVTKQLAIRGALEGQNQSFAIVLDNVLESDPIIDYQQNPQGIAGGKAEITGSFTLREAKDLALVLNTGALPVTLTPIQKQQVSATLGKDSLRAGLFAGAAGMILVLIFMVVVYRFLGLIADVALIIYAILLWGVFNAVPVTLTLPGIAGMILTIGVAADANVVVFERIKEEVRRGKSVRSAISSGYGKGFRTILDANILIILTALVLFYFATAQPKGFALTLMIGTVVSLFTAVLATRAMLGLLGGLALFDKDDFMGVRAGEELFAGEFANAIPKSDGAQGRGRRRAAPGVASPSVSKVRVPADEAEALSEEAVAPAVASQVTARKRPATGKNGQRRPPAKKRKKRR